MKPVFASFDDFQKRGRTVDAIGVGDFVACRITEPGTGTHIVEPLFQSSLREFSRIEHLLFSVCSTKPSLFFYGTLFFLTGAIISLRDALEQLLIDQSEDVASHEREKEILHCPEDLEQLQQRE